MLGKIKNRGAAGLLVLLFGGCDPVTQNETSAPLPQQANGSGEQGPIVSSERLPNIIYILADDLGYGDVGAYGQTRIRTPNIDNLARQGLKFTQHYAGSTVCAPSRASLLTGQHTGHVQIRGNAERGGFLDEEEFGQHPLEPETPTIATMLKAAGYQTAAIGKWGLGGPGSGSEPGDHGFDHFFGYLDQKQAHNYYPTHLWRNGERVPLNNRFFIPHAELAETSQVAEDYQLYMGEDYAPDFITAEALDYVRSSVDEPFFLYLAYVAPHAALQVPDESLREYDDLNWDEPEMQVVDYTPHPRPRAARAAMISHMDRDIGRLVALLETLELADNTLIIFSSDNGPSYEGGADLDFFRSSGQLRGGKRDLSEGGIRVPMIAAWPGRIAANTVTESVSAFWDVAPTLAEVAGADMFPGGDGQSFLPVLLGQEESGREQPLYWEFSNKRRGYHGAQAVRIGHWKGIRLDGIANRAAPIRLYDLRSDQAEQYDVAADHPQVVRQMEEVMAARSTALLEQWEFPLATWETPQDTEQTGNN